MYQLSFETFLKYFLTFLYTSHCFFSNHILFQEYFYCSIIFYEHYLFVMKRFQDSINGLIELFQFVELSRWPKPNSSFIDRVFFLNKIRRYTDAYNKDSTSNQFVHHSYYDYRCSGHRHFDCWHNIQEVCTSY